MATWPVRPSYSIRKRLRNVRPRSASCHYKRLHILQGKIGALACRRVRLEAYVYAQRWPKADEQVRRELTLPVLKPCLSLAHSLAYA